MHLGLRHAVHDEPVNDVDVAEGTRAAPRHSSAVGRGSGDDAVLSQNDHSDRLDDPKDAVRRFDRPRFVANQVWRRASAEVEVSWRLNCRQKHQRVSRM
jgi:hypothetical protein